MISEEAETTYHITALSSLSTLTAVFTPIYYNVKLSYDEIGGIVRGLGSGRYEYGTTVHLQATPARFYTFDCWMVNGNKVGTDENLDITINGETQIEVRFTYTPPRLTTTYSLAEGWNWISLNPTDATLLNPRVLLAPLGNKVLEIRGKGMSLVRENDSWTGDLTELNPGEFYQVHVSEAATLNIDSRIPEANVITLKRGWTNLSFDAAEELPIATALTNWNAWENDMVKSQDGFAIYDGSQWVGTLTTMQPGKGYQFYSQTVASFSYPTSPIEEDITNVADFQEDNAAAGARPQGNINSMAIPRRDYADNMCIVANISDGDVVCNFEKYIIGAFADNTCRGISELVDGKYFITVYGTDNDRIEYNVFDNSKSMFVDTEGNTIFDRAFICNLKLPTEIIITEPDGIGSLNPDSTSKGNDSIYDLQGRKVGNRSQILDSQLPKGIYIINGKKVVIK